MTMPQSSEELQLLIAGYVLGDLSPEEADQFEQIIARDPTIAAEIAQMQMALEVTYAPTEVSPSPDLRSRILEAAQTNTPQSITDVGTRRIRQRLSLRTVLEIAAAALIVALGVNNYRLAKDLQFSQAETQKYAALTYQLQATQANSLASAKVVVNPNTLKGTISVQNLPPLPAGKVYVLWTVLKPAAPFTTDDKDAILTQVFAVDDRGSLEIVAPPVFRSKEFVTKVAVTIESATAPQKHIGKPIMVTKL